MSATIKLNEIFVENKNLLIKFEDDVNVKSIVAYCYYNYKSYIPICGSLKRANIDCISDSNSVSIPLSNLFSQFACEANVTSIELNAILDDGEKAQIISDKSNIVLYETEKFTIRSSFDNKHNLLLNLSFKEYTVQCNSIILNNNQAIFELEQLTQSYDFIVLRRYKIDTSAGEIVYRKTINSNIIELPLEMFDIYAMAYTFDFYAKVIIEELNIYHQVPIKYESYELSTPYKQVSLKFYQNRQKYLSLYCNLTVFTKQINVSHSDNTLFINYADNLLLFDSSKVLVKRLSANELNQIFDIKVEGNYTLYECNDTFVSKLITNREDTFDLVGKDRDYVIVANTQGLSIRVKKKTKPIKIATWSSCYFRQSFRNFINPNWRDFFEIVSHYFQPSLFSLTSKPIEILQQSDFVIDDNTARVKREFEKTALKELAESGAQYILIDFYADVFANAYRLDDGSFIGGHLNLINDPTIDQIKKYLSDIKDKGTQVNVYYAENYLDAWKQKCDIFCDMLKDIGYGDKVIITTGYFNSVFLDNVKNTIHDLRKEKIPGKTINEAYLEEKLQLWKQMNEYFVKKLPQTKVININYCNYYSNYNSPMLGPHHFQPNYYRHLMSEICKLILFEQK